MENWLKDKDLDVAVWKDLPANFEERTGTAFTNDNAIAYLKGLEGIVLAVARDLYC